MKHSITFDLNHLQLWEICRIIDYADNKCKLTSVYSGYTHTITAETDDTETFQRLDEFHKKTYGGIEEWFGGQNHDKG